MFDAARSRCFFSLFATLPEWRGGCESGVTKELVVYIVEWKATATKQLSSVQNLALQHVFARRLTCKIKKEISFFKKLFFFFQCKTYFIQQSIHINISWHTVCVLEYINIESFWETLKSKGLVGTTSSLWSTVLRKESTVCPCPNPFCSI